MSAAAANKDVSPAMVRLILGVAIGIPASVLAGIVTGETGWGLFCGPIVGLVLGGILAATAPRPEAS